jgi:glycosyltransferase involved in cell wall biosynthesis
MTRPELSVLTPSWQYAHFIPAAIHSVEAAASEEGVAVEHVVADAASLDGTPDVLRAAEWSGLHWVSEPDQGQSDGLNKAFTMSRGEIIGWLNADEFYLPGALAAVAEVFEAEPTVDVVYGDVVRVDAEGRIQRVASAYPFSSRALAWRGCVIMSAAAFFRRSALAADGPHPWRTDLRFVMDWDLYHRLRVQGSTFRYLNRPLSGFRVHPDQISGALPRTDAELIGVRRHYGLPGRGPLLPAVLATGDLLHKGLKVRHGATRRERRVRHLTGRSLLAGDGVDAVVMAEILRCYDL